MPEYAGMHGSRAMRESGCYLQLPPDFLHTSSGLGHCTSDACVQLGPKAPR